MTRLGAPITGGETHQDHGTLVEDEPAVPPEPHRAPAAEPRWVQLELPLDLLDDPVALEVWRAL